MFEALKKHVCNANIPWDDDVDVVLPREDYNKLMDVACELQSVIGDRLFSLK